MSDFAAALAQSITSGATPASTNAQEAAADFLARIRADEAKAAAAEDAAPPDAPAGPEVAP